jgi:hypothetical protein
MERKSRVYKMLGLIILAPILRWNGIQWLSDYDDTI